MACQAYSITIPYHAHSTDAHGHGPLNLEINEPLSGENQGAGVCSDFIKSKIRGLKVKSNK